VRRRRLRHAAHRSWASSPPHRPLRPGAVVPSISSSSSPLPVAAPSCRCRPPVLVSAASSAASRGPSLSPAATLPRCRRLQHVVLDFLLGSSHARGPPLLQWRSQDFELCPLLCSSIRPCSIRPSAQSAHCGFDLGLTICCCGDFAYTVVLC
jgi:hypothetical protein